MFDGDNRFPENDNHSHIWDKIHSFIPTVIGSNQVMLEQCIPDSIETMYELDRQLNIEAAEAKEMKTINEVRKNM